MSLLGWILLIGLGPVAIMVGLLLLGGTAAGATRLAGAPFRALHNAEPGTDRVMAALQIVAAIFVIGLILSRFA